MLTPETTNPELLTGLNLEVMSAALELAAYARPTEDRAATWQVRKSADITILRQADMGNVLENAFIETPYGLLVSSIHVAKGGYLDRQEDAMQRAVLLRSNGEPLIFRTNFIPDGWRYNFKKLVINHGQDLVVPLLLNDPKSAPASMTDMENTMLLIDCLKKDLSIQDTALARKTRKKLGSISMRSR